jgi:hypothetical protein
VVAGVGSVNVNEILDGHIVLDLECLDRIYLNAYVPDLQVPGQVVTFFQSTPQSANSLAGFVRRNGQGLPCRGSCVR